MLVLKSFHICLKTITALFALVLILFGAFFGWVITGPRSLTLLSPYVEEELNDLSADFNIRMGDSFIKWDNYHNTLSISVQDVKLINDKNEIVGDFPELLFDFSIWRFLGGNILSSDVTVIRPNFYINSAYDSFYPTTQKPKSELTEGFFAILYQQLKSKDTNFTFRSLKVRDAEFFISNGLSDLVWHVTEGYARIGGHQKGRKIVSEFSINFGNIETFFNVELIHSDVDQLDLNVVFKDLPSYAVTDVFPKVIDIFERIDAIASGTINFLLTPKGNIPQFNFSVSDIKGTFKFPEYFKKDIQVNYFKANGNFYNNFSLLTLDKLYADLNGPKVNLAGTVSNNAPFPQLSPEINIEGDVQDMQVDMLDDFWPIKLKPKLRHWITQNISSGNVINAKGAFKLSNNEIKKMIERAKLIKQGAQNIDYSPPISDDSIHAQIQIKGSEVLFHHNYPRVTDIIGTINISGHRFNAKLDSAKILTSNLKDTSIDMPNMWLKPLMIDISSHTSGKAQDYITILKTSQKNKKVTPIIESLYKGSGKGSGTFSLTVPVKKKMRYNELNLKFDSTFSDVSLPDFYKSKNISQANFDFILDNNNFKVKGKAIFDNLPVEFDHHQYLYGKRQYDYQYAIKTRSTADQFRSVGIDIPFVNGEISVDYQLTKSKNTNKIKGSADFTNASLNVAAIDLSKAQGTSATATFSAIAKHKKPLVIERFAIKGDDLEANGKAKLSSDFKQVSSLNIDNIKYGLNDLRVRYHSNKAGFKVNIKGKSIDLSGINLTKTFRSTNTNNKTIDAKADIERVYMKNGQSFTDINTNIQCDLDLCSSVNLYGKIGNDNYLAMSMKPIGDRSSLLVESDNAGAIINALNISKHIKGGHLYIDSTFTKRDNTTVARGNARIRDFKAVKTPVLGKLLTLASFKGILDLLNQEGISFKKFEAPFEMSNGVITITDAKSSGASVGITSKGTLDTNKGNIDFKGAIVPAYEFNKVIGNIPLLGNLLVGKKNEGLIATKYRVHGTYGDIKTDVNPFSILTPGFLRNVFDAIPEAE